jgi:small subunit ribosomal protein S7
MARRGEIPKRKVLPDPKFRDRMVSKFTNVLMFGGKRSVAEQIVYGAIDVIQERYKADALETFRKALDACKP